MGKTFKTAIILIISFVLLVFYVYKSGFNLNSSQQETFELLLKVYLAASLYCFIAGELTKNYSQVDRLWSLIPIAYAGIILWSDPGDPRLWIAAGMITLWGLRLTFNFARKGGYHWLPWKGEEDYRWQILQKEKSFSKPLVWSAFNLFFICFYQIGLILYFTLPPLLSVGDSPALNWIDAIAVGLFVFAFLIELIADEQQFKFQTEKYRRIKLNEELVAPYDKGFIDSGLWAYMRHPNYFGEQLTWVSVYLVGVSASGQWINWTIGGVILLILLFRGSSDFSEGISSGKYPAYKNYQERVGRFIPKIKF